MIERSLEIINSLEREPLQDHCGIVGILASEETTLFEEGLQGLSSLQTRGYDGAGFAALRTDDTILLHKAKGTIAEVFKPGVVSKLRDIPFYSALYQTRYGTNGEFSSDNVQPFITRHRLTNEIFMVNHNGQFSTDTTANRDYRSDTAKFVDRLSLSNGDNWDEKVISTLSREKGAWSIIINVSDSMYLARDPLGIRPLYYSQKCEEGVIVSAAASETTSLTNMGFSDHREVLPGQLIKFDRSTPDIKSTQMVESTHRAHCVFENIYTLDERGKALLARSTSTEIQKADSVATLRKRYGEVLANEAPLTHEQVDFIVGIPGTAITGGEAFAKALNLPYIQAITDKNTEQEEQRTFMQADVIGILKKVQKHFNFDRDALFGKRVGVVDDSIVRGNVSIGIAQLLKEYYGVSEVHFRVLCPPIDKSCFLGINTRQRNELIAAKYIKESKDYGELVEHIREELGVESLAYLSSKGLMLATTGEPDSHDYCMGCMVTHEPPIDQYGN